MPRISEVVVATVTENGHRYNRIRNFSNLNQLSYITSDIIRYPLSIIRSPKSLNMEYVFATFTRDMLQPFLVPAQIRIGGLITLAHELFGFLWTDMK
jgi:hypothetical protein